MANLVTEIGRAGVAHALLLKDAADELYKSIVKIGFCAIIGILVMWVVNAIGAKELNFVFFFIGIIVFAIWVFAPTRLLIAAGAGAAIEGLQDKDLTQGAVKGITTLYQVALGVMLWFMIAAGILSVISFQAKPMAFFPIVAMLLLITVGYSAVKNGTVKGFIATFGTLVIIFYLWALVPEDWKFWKSSENATQPGKVVQGAMSGRMDNTESQAIWTGVEPDGSAPVGVWSLEVTVPFGCGVHFSP